MNRFEEEIKEIFRLRVPFDRIYTSVFLLRTSEGNILVDCATTAEDVDTVILPALRALGYELSDLRAIVLTHRHSDHAGGLARICALAPDLSVLTEVGTRIGEIELYPLTGHTLDSVGIYDSRTHTLIAGDGLQGAGVDRYPCSLASKEAYRATINRIRADESIENILFSHAYEPWKSDRAEGREEVLACLRACEEIFKKQIGETV